MRFDRSTALYALVALAVLCGFLLGLYGLTPPGDRTSLLLKVVGPVGSIVTAVVAGVSARVAHQARASVESQAPVLEDVRHQTNGALTDRLNRAINDALDSRGLTVPDVGPAPDDTYSPDDAAAAVPYTGPVT